MAPAQHTFADINNAKPAIGCIPEWIASVRGADKTARDYACAALWNAFQADVLRVARNESGALGFTVENDDDIAIRAFATLFSALFNGRFPNVQSRQQFWSLLRTITQREASRVRARHFANRRGVKQQISLEAIREDRAIRCRRSASPCYRIQIAELIASVTIEEQRIINLLHEGYSLREIAAQIRLSQRTVERRLAKLRRQLNTEARALIERGSSK